MSSLLLALALAATGGRIAFAGAVVTPTSRNSPVVSLASDQHASRPTVLAGRFDNPARVVRVKPARQGGDVTEVIVTYF